MAYESVDSIQKALAEDVFHYAKDKKKAAGRALGTLVEIINFYLLKAWGYETNVAIERRIPEYANADIMHNVEFTLHPTKNLGKLKLSKVDLPFSAQKIRRKINVEDWEEINLKSTQLLSSTEILRNSCIIYEDNRCLLVAYLGDKKRDTWNISVEELRLHPFAMFECKRVGVEEGVKKGPQTIEKAKQGAYVAKTVSSLQKIRMPNGDVHGALHVDGKLQTMPYQQFLKSVIDSNDLILLEHFVLTVGVVSNHGNWFTSDDHNKELKVLSQSYDWLLFLTDIGLAQFVKDLLLSPKSKYSAVKDAFLSSYTGARGKNKFTKVQISLEADRAIQNYFSSNINNIEGWFNVISPPGKGISELKSDLDSLVTKNWEEILK